MRIERIPVNYRPHFSSCEHQIVSKRGPVDGEQTKRREHMFLLELNRMQHRLHRKQSHVVPLTRIGMELFRDHKMDQAQRRSFESVCLPIVRQMTLETLQSTDKSSETCFSYNLQSMFLCRGNNPCRNIFHK